MRAQVISVLLLLLLMTGPGCATTKATRHGSGAEGVQAFAAAAQPAWSARSSQRKMVVAVSPARQTLQMVGLTGAVLGASISAISDARHRRAIEEVLEGFDAGALFDAHLAERLEALAPGLQRVPPPAARSANQDGRDAARARYASLGRAGHELLLDLDMTYGIFGYEGTLIAKLDGEIRELPGGRLLWKDTILVSSEEVLATDRLTDPTNRMKPNFSSPRLSVGEGAIDQWTGDGGELLRARMREAIEGATSALITELELAEEAKGYYYLGRGAMNRKQFDIAQGYFARALALEPGNSSIRNAMSVNLAHNGQVQDAVALAEEIAASDPSYGPAHYNLAWWYAVELNAPEQARPYYERALTLGMPQERKLDKALDG